MHRTVERRDSKLQAGIAALLRSAKFRSWRQPAIKDSSEFSIAREWNQIDSEPGSGSEPAHADLQIAMETHYSPAELAEKWGVSIETIRVIFRDEPGVLKIGKPGTRYKRQYFTLRIPETVAERVHQRLSS